MTNPLLLVHGFPLDRRTWAPQGEALTASRRVLSPDLPGFGGTPADPGLKSIEDFAGWLLADLDRQGVGQVCAAGHSMGGYVVLAMHRLAPERLLGLGLVCSRAAPDGDEGRQAREATAQRVEKEGTGFLVEAMPAKLFGSSPSLETLEILRSSMRAASRAGTAAASRAMGARPDARPQLPGIRVPCVIVAGRKDGIIPPSESEAMAKAVPGARLVWAEQSGHLPTLEEPGLVTEALSTLP